MKIIKIYENYEIMPQLQLHQLRVASVASIVMNCFRKPLDKNTVITACLLHDMGNIIKFDLGLYPKYLKGRGLAYWEGVQNKFKRNYGEDEHKATYKICNEIGVNDKVKRTIKAFGFSNSKKIYKSDNFEVKIGSYSDMRVAPYGIETLKTRMDEGSKRYKNVPKYKNNIQPIKNFWEKIEQQIFFHCRIGPGDITADRTDKLIRDLRNFEVRKGNI